MDARKQGNDPKDIILIENVRNGYPGKEITKCYDTSMKSHTLYSHVWGKVKPMAKAISEARERGVNPMDIPLTAGLQAKGAGKG
ncbi:hypothetical protein LAWI1_G001154 [Lachnellula willkommii]|uniref:Uncharacterized protein n=1 Tax=Lachnellula willkommii TaxID=215461 RepID=A0A559MCB5_9HELO|nr:hypothetical protein LAWI1_G001154 [Lachnellula willkommii]